MVKKNKVARAHNMSQGAHTHTPMEPLCCYTLLQDAVAQLTPGKKIWAQDIAKDGKKRFVLASTSEFWEYYKTAKIKNYHEIVYKDRPCTMYLDFDCTRDLNAGPVLLFRFVDLATHLLKKMTNGTIRVFMCDASNDLKFSRHVLFEIDKGKTKFANAHACGAFCSVVVKKLGIDCSDVDTNVYDKNHPMRILLSSKFGEYRPFVPVNESSSLSSVELEDFENYLIQKDSAAAAPRLISFADSTLPLTTLLSPDAPFWSSSAAYLAFVSASSSSSSSSGAIRNFQTGFFPPYVFAVADYLATTWDRCKVAPFSFDPVNLVAYFKSTSKICRVKQKATGIEKHTNNTVFFKCYLRKQTFTQYCHSRSPSCYQNQTKLHSDEITIDPNSRCAMALNSEIRLKEAAIEIFNL